MGSCMRLICFRKLWGGSSESFFALYILRILLVTCETYGNSLFHDVKGNKGAIWPLSIGLTVVLLGSHDTQSSKFMTAEKAFLWEPIYFYFLEDLADCFWVDQNLLNFISTWYTWMVKASCLTRKLGKSLPLLLEWSLRWDFKLQLYLPFN